MILMCILCRCWCWVGAGFWVLGAGSKQIVGASQSVDVECREATVSVASVELFSVLCGTSGYFCATVNYVSLDCKQEKHLWTAQTKKNWHTTNTQRTNNITTYLRW